MFFGNSTRESALIVCNNEPVTYFILQTQTGTSVCHNQHRNNLGEVLEKNAGEWTGRVEISKEAILAVGVACMAIYMDLLKA